MGKIKILYFGSQKTVEGLQKYAYPNTILEVGILEEESKFPDIVYYSYEPIDAKANLKAFKKAEDDGYDAIVVGCWYDPCVREG